MMTDTASTSVPLIDAATVRRLTPMPALIDALADMFRGDSFAPARHAHPLSPDASMLIMPAWQAGGSIGVKIATVHRHDSPSVKATYILLEEATGRPRAILDGTTLTARRTAAASALAARYLAPDDACHLLVIGTGALVPHLVEAHACVRPIDRVTIWGRDQGKAAALAASLGDRGVEARAAHDLAAAVGEADVISAATLSNTALVRGADVGAGTHIDLIGAFRSDMCEADPATFAKARVFVDTREGVLEEAGDLLQAISAGALSEEAIEADLADLARGRHPGRGDHRSAVTLFKSVGTALEDLAAADMVFRGWQAEHA